VGGGTNIFRTWRRKLQGFSQKLQYFFRELSNVDLEQMSRNRTNAPMKDVCFLEGGCLPLSMAKL
jgi:hypothetical protein